MCCIDMGAARVCLCINIYGWDGADTDTTAMSRTDHLFDIIKEEIDARPMMPSIIMGDFNATIRNIPSARHLLDELA